MATHAEVTSRIEATLRAVTAEVDDLPLRAQEWHDETDDNRMAFALEWKELMDRLSLVDEAAFIGMMAPPQRTFYQEVRRKLEAARPLTERLSLRQPPTLPNGLVNPPSERLS